MSRKILVLVLILVSALLLTACAPADTGSTDLEAQIAELQAQLDAAAASGAASEEQIAELQEQLAQAEVEQAAEAASAEGKTLIVWWSHWANEPAKRLVIERIVADYEAANPDVDIVLTWWDKNPLRDAVRSTMTAGDGAPDITTFDTEVREWAEAGWLMDLEDVLPWENFIPSAYEDARYAGIDGIYKFNISAIVNLLLYNKDIFAELGIEVPEDRQFTQAEFLEVVQACDAAGYAGVANAIGNRPHTGRRAFEDILIPFVGADAFADIIHGDADTVDTPEFRAWLAYVGELRDAGMLPETYATMTIDEMHIYFHTQREACMLFVPTWYTGRAFQAQASGGQDPTWPVGMMLPPAMDGAAEPNTVRASFESGYAILSTTDHPDVAADILVFASQPQYGALWTAVTNSPTAILYDKATDWPSPELLEELGVQAGVWDWYWDEFNATYGSADIKSVTDAFSCGEFGDAWVSMINEGYPLGLVTIDEVVATVDAALCK